MTVLEIADCTGNSPNELLADCNDENEPIITIAVRHLLTHFCRKRHFRTLFDQGLNYWIINELISNQLIEVTDGKGAGLYLQTSLAGRRLLKS
jgi:hypothetical protein